jgi:hypothetical protein
MMFVLCGDQNNLFTNTVRTVTYIFLLTYLPTYLPTYVLTYYLLAPWL